MSRISRKIEPGATKTKNYIVEQEIDVVEIPDEFDDLMYQTREVGSRSE